MYQDYWKLTDRPFPHRVPATACYPAASRLAALRRLQYCIQNSAGCAVILGESGLGKTSLLRQLQATEEHLRPFVHLVFPGLDAPAQLRQICGQLSDAPFATERSTDKILSNAENALPRHAANGRPPVICFDDAQLLSPQVMTDVVLALLNLRDIDDSLDFTVILAGQPILLSLLSRQPQLRERVAVTARLAGMTDSETADYISGRLRACGASADLFTKAAIRRLQETSQGNPRRLNRLCDMALLVGCAEQLDRIDAPQIDAVGTELIRAA